MDFIEFMKLVDPNHKVSRHHQAMFSVIEAAIADGKKVQVILPGHMMGAVYFGRRPDGPIILDDLNDN